MSNVKFPKVPGLGWNVKRTPVFSTVIQPTAVPGAEVRVQYATQPQWKLTAMWEFLRDKSPDENGLTELTTVLGFFLQRMGAFDSFWINLTEFTGNDADSIVTGAPIGTGDGATLAFQVTRNYGGYTENCYAPQVSAVYDAGNLVDPANYTVSNGMIVFTVAPTAGHAISVDYVFYYLVRFEKDEAEFNNFQFQLYEMQEITFLSLRP